MSEKADYKLAAAGAVATLGHSIYLLENQDAAALPGLTLSATATGSALESFDLDYNILED